MRGDLNADTAGRGAYREASEYGILEYSSITGSLTVANGSPNRDSTEASSNRRPGSVAFSPLVPSPFGASHRTVRVASSITTKRVRIYDCICKHSVPKSDTLHSKRSNGEETDRRYRRERGLNRRGPKSSTALPALHASEEPRSGFSSPRRRRVSRTDTAHLGQRQAIDRSSVGILRRAALKVEAEYHWAIRVWDESGEPSAWSEPARWEMGLLEPADWEAIWIRHPSDEAGEQPHFTYLRREFSLNGSIERARASVSASHQYGLSVNGEPIDRGQAFSYPDFQYYKTVDLTEAPTTGSNAVGALTHWSGAGQGRPAAQPRFVCQLVVEFTDGTERTIRTDESWRVREAEWLEDAPQRNDEIAEPVERTDGRRTPIGWTQPGFDTSGWDRAAVVGTHPTEPWTRLVAQSTDVVRSSVEPASMNQLEDGTVVVDFGRVYPGLLEVDFTEGVDGHRVEFRAGYLLEDDGTVSADEGTQWTDMRYEYVQRDGECRFRPFNVLGFRYLQIDDPGERLEPEQVRLLATRFSVPTSGPRRSNRRTTPSTPSSSSRATPRCTAARNSLSIRRPARRVSSCSTRTICPRRRRGRFASER
ncbi:alpha-L-rhamnosidase [Halostagnicola kamekurae]|uniref:Alpha-L-rhamnosidase n=1 Tax=Halostagnicola kamekurae TaxID=619731 RepID=A0A1I6TM21_9EURY|nr:alpha-L-rhamnosidase [Halostagnicola kamekurae]